MYTVTTLLLYALAAEIFRRCFLVLLAAFTGPLSKIPGPVVGKFTSWPWIIQCVMGNQMNIGPGYFEKYGDVVRVGEHHFLQSRPSVDIRSRTRRHPLSRQGYDPK